MAERSDPEQALLQLRVRLPFYQLYHDYYAGRHRLMFGSERFVSAFARLFRGFAANHCPAVLNALADRLEVAGFGVQGETRGARRETRVGEGEGEATDAGDAAWDLWLWNRMDQDAGEVHLEALRAGDGYVIVWPNPAGEVTIYPQRAAHLTVRYAEEQPGVLLWAAKGWLTDEELFRLTLYYPDRIEKYITRGKVTSGIPEKEGAFIPYEEEGRPWPLPNPWGQVPVFHFANDACLGRMGTSELTAVIPLQDALNKSLMDLLVGAEFVSLPQRWVTGLELETDAATGETRQPFVPGVHKLWTAESEETKFGQFPESSFENLIALQETWVTMIARVTGTPLHYLLMITDPPSGRALRVLEKRLIEKVRDRMTAWGAVWKDVMSLALTMQAGAVPPPLTTEWVDPETPDTSEKAEAFALLARSGIPLQAAARAAGYDQEEAMALGQVDFVDGITQ